MSFVWLVVRHNLKWMAALALIFAFASGILSNASSLSQWYSKTLTEDFLDVTRIDFVVDQKGLAGKVADMHRTIPRLEEVTGVISEMQVTVGFPMTVEFEKKSDDETSWWSCSGIMVTVHAPSGTSYILNFGIELCSYLGSEKLIKESDIGAPYPKQGEAVVSRDLAKLLDMGVGDNLTIETLDGLLTFQVSGITDLSYLTVQEKIRKPDSPLQFFPSTPPVEELEFVHTKSGELYLVLSEISMYRTNWFAIISPEDSIDLFGRDWITETTSYSISHYVYAKREKLVESLNIDKTVSNLLRARDRIELIASEAPASVRSDILTIFETASSEVNLFAVIAGGFMLAALPLYWFVASPITNLFVERKRSEIALLRIRGLSLRGISLAYTSLIAASAVAGGVLGAFLQANILQILASLHVIGPQYAETSTGLGLTIPDAGSLFLYVIISLALAILSVRKIIRSVASLQPAEATRLAEKRETASKRVGTLTILLLCLGLAKLVMQLVGWNSMVYFKHPPSNPFLGMGLALFAAFDNYALTTLAPVFLAYGFAKLISVKSDRFAALFRPFSLLAGLKKREISFRLLSSEMWRTAASLILITLVLSYGIGSYVSNCTVTEHTWRLAGEFTGADIRVDCPPNATQGVEENIKAIPELSNYTRIDVLISYFQKFVGTTHFDAFRALIAIDPEIYVEVAYLENAPELREAIANLEPGHIIGLKGVQWVKFLGGQLMTSCTFPIVNIPKDWDQILLSHRLMSNETVVFDIDEWFNITVPSTVESMETIKVTTPLEEILTTAYSVPYSRFEAYIADVLLPHTSEGALFDLGGFLIRQENKPDIKHEHIKSIFVVKLKSGADLSNVAAELRSAIHNESVTITTRSEAVGVMRKGYPRLAVGIDFTEINRTLITSMSLGGLVAIAITTTIGRKGVLCRLRIKGGKRKDGVALFLPETALVAFLACLLGTTIGVTLGFGFVNSMADLIPPLFTGNTVQTFFGPSIWYFAATVLAVFSTIQIVSIAAKSVIDLGAL
jgi:hypothetical protein